MLLINCEIFTILISKLCNSEGDRETTFAITDAKLHVAVVTL